jgi:hypothetical protein
MTLARRMFAAVIGCALTACLGMTDATMANEPVVAALFRVVALAPGAGQCVAARLERARPTAGSLVEATFCEADDVARLRRAQQRTSFVTLRSAEGAAARVLPVTVGLDVSIVGRDPAGHWKISALPRPMPLLLPSGETAQYREIEAAAAAGKSVVFALYDAVRIADIVIVDRQAALAMLGMER